MHNFPSKACSILIAIVFVTVTAGFGQTRSDTETTPVSAKSAPAKQKTIFRDSDGNLVSNNEFVDIRMANPSYRDATIVHTLDDGTIEFRLQKIPQEGETSRPFSLRALTGKDFDSEALTGQVVVLNFWFIGCPPCMAEIPKLNDLKQKFAADDDVVFVAMTADDAHEVKNFLQREKFEYNVIANAKPTLDSFRFAGYPKNIVVGKDGKIVYWRTIIRSWDKFESVIKTELEK